jgi:putative copper export protein
MLGIYLLSVWLHIMAAVVWVGGTIFLVIVLVPAIRRPEFGGFAVALIRFTALLLISVFHDFSLGPRAAAA